MAQIIQLHLISSMAVLVSFAYWKIDEFKAQKISSSASARAGVSSRRRRNPLPGRREPRSVEWRRRAMGRIFIVEKEGRSYRCKFCNTQLALADDLASQAFHCRRGKAYLFNNAINISFGALEERMMLSGLHIVADVLCCTCGQNVGWKYEAAHEKSQKYKEGKFVLERGRIVDDIEFSTGFYIDSRSGLSDSEDN